MKTKSAAAAASVVPLAIGLAAFSLSPGTVVSPSGAKPAAPSAVTSTAAGFTSGLKAGCTLPFKEIATPGLEVDQSCSVDGNSDDTGKRLESEAKNNFCVSGKPVSIEYDDLRHLEEAADKDEELRKRLKNDRGELVNIATSAKGAPIGEGTLVRFVAFILDAHYSNLGKGELVNCNQGGKPFNDIHIELTKDAKDTEECNSVTAEMSPHFRPLAWAELPTAKIANPVRFTGPLFFDGSHRPCSAGKRPSPSRMSVWEIHPVYQIEVCKDKELAKCKVDVNSAWIPFDEFQSDIEEE